MIFGRAGEEIDACREGRHRDGSRARNYGGAGRGKPARHVADPSQRRAPRAISHRPRRERRAARRISTGAASPTRAQRLSIYMPKKTLRRFADAIAGRARSRDPGACDCRCNAAGETMSRRRSASLPMSTLPDGPTIVMIGSVCAGALTEASGYESARRRQGVGPSRA